ncbi:MAG: DUF1566 domain-containing protein [Treponema sp.]|nr:DUF1566 domain-containing protein [Treponema sp.]
MKNKFKVMGIIALTVLLVFSLVTCTDNGSTGGGGDKCKCNNPCLAVNCNCTDCPGGIVDPGCECADPCIIADCECTDCPGGCTNHDWDWTQDATAATCTQPSKDTATCKNAGCTATNEQAGSIEALGHDVAAVAATCQAPGNTGEGTCARCGTDVEGNEIPINANNHVWGEYIQTTPPTCTAKGIKTQTCTLCPAVNPVTEEGDEINANNHDWTLSRVLISEGVNAKTCNNSGCNEKSDFEFIYNIGDTIPDRGIIFYVADGQSDRPLGFTVQGYGTPVDEGYFAEYTAYYLEAAPENISGYPMWADDSNDLIPGLSQDWFDETDWAIGRGRLNTSIIIARGISQSYTTPAASACANLRTGDKDDWFLPSINELHAFMQLYWFPPSINKLNTFMQLSVQLYRTPGYLHWSSSQCDAEYAYCYDIEDYVEYEPFAFQKDTSYMVGYVRAVRAF